MKRVTLRDIARALDLSPSTVGLALGSADAPLRRYLKKETILRIEEKARELGYAPHHGARVMRQKKSNLIILLNFSGYTEIVSERVFHLGRIAHEAGYDSLTIDAFWWLNDPVKTLEYVYSFQPEGIVLLGNPRAALQAEHFERLASWGIPLVSLAMTIRGVPSIRHDIAGAIRSLTQQAIQSGRRRIAFLIGGGERLPSDWSWQARERLSAFQSVLEEHDIFPGERSHLELPHFSPRSKRLQGAIIMRKRERGTFDDYEASHRIARELFEAPVLPDALLCSNDDLAICVMTECARHNIPIPETLWTCGFDNRPITAHLPVPLTSVAHPTETLCIRAMEVLLRMMTEKTGPIHPREEEHLLPCQIVWRESTGHPSQCRESTALHP